MFPQACANNVPKSEFIKSCICTNDMYAKINKCVGSGCAYLLRDSGSLDNAVLEYVKSLYRLYEGSSFLKFSIGSLWIIHVFSFLDLEDECGKSVERGS